MNAPTDMSQVIIPRSDQINADTLLAGPMTVTIKEVQIRGGQEQPVSIMLEETELAYRPCKSMSRVLVQAWGPDAKQYIGRSLTLYRDPTVKWAGMEVGGIRISHLSHIDGKMQMQLTATKGQRKPHIVMPLVIEQRVDKAAEWVAEQIAAVAACTDAAALEALIAKGAKAMGKLEKDRAPLHAQVTAAIAEKRSQLSGSEPGATMLDDDDPFGSDDVQPWTAYVATTTKRIEEAATPAELDEIAGTLNDSSGLPEDELTKLDTAIAKKRRALAKG